MIKCAGWKYHRKGFLKRVRWNRKETVCHAGVGPGNRNLVESMASGVHHHDERRMCHVMVLVLASELCYFGRFPVWDVFGFTGRSGAFVSAVVESTSAVVKKTGD